MIRLPVGDFSGRAMPPERVRESNSPLSRMQRDATSSTAADTTEIATLTVNDENSGRNLACANGLL